MRQKVRVTGRRFAPSLLEQMTELQTLRERVRLAEAARRLTVRSGARDRKAALCGNRRDSSRI